MKRTIRRSIERNKRKDAEKNGKNMTRFTAGQPLRKQRRLDANKEGIPFVPQYDTWNADSPVTYETLYGVGYERFNNKFVTIAEVAD